MKKYIALALVLTFMLSLVACAPKYRSQDFIGKTSKEIEAEYGSFDCAKNDRSEDGLYRNCSCGYTIKEPQVGYLGTSPEELFFISFDENGVATDCYEGYRPGG